VIGIRAQLRRVADPAFVTRPNVVANLAAALNAGLNVTVLAEVRHYEHLLPVLDRLPPGPGDAQPPRPAVPDTDRAAWRAAMRRFARRPELYVQLSGVPFLYRERWREDPAALALLDEAFDVFGAQR
jgi:L-fuconolactonase